MHPQVLRNGAGVAGMGPSVLPLTPACSSPGAVTDAFGGTGAREFNRDLLESLARGRSVPVSSSPTADIPNQDHLPASHHRTRSGQQARFLKPRGEGLAGVLSVNCGHIDLARWRCLRSAKRPSMLVMHGRMRGPT